MRATAFTVAGVLLAVVSSLLGRLLPDSLTLDLGQNAVGSILQILASSMLAVTTFSLTAMVSAYSSAASLGTPRSTQLLVRDRTSHNALSTFVGTFAFSVVGIIDRVETAATAAVDSHREDPLSGASPWTPPPPDAVPVPSETPVGRPLPRSHRRDPPGRPHMPLRVSATLVGCAP